MLCIGDRTMIGIASAISADRERIGGLYEELLEGIGVVIKDTPEICSNSTQDESPFSSSITNVTSASVVAGTILAPVSHKFGPSAPAAAACHHDVLSVVIICDCVT